MPDLTQVSIVGGGRWARVLAETACELVSPAALISVHSQHCIAALNEWAVNKGLADRVRISAEWPTLDQPKSAAVLVVNAARDHEAAARHALSAGASVLIEKPIALSAASAYGLAGLAHGVNSKLAVSNVFLFADYIRRFSRLVGGKGELRSIAIRWVDVSGEHRYGEEKKYDAGLPVYADVLPHVSAILGLVAPRATQRCESVRVMRGGAEVELRLRLGSIPCRISLVRNGEARERVIVAQLEHGSVRLDFSVEPGIIFEDEVALDSDPSWAANGRPLRLMLRAFFEWVETGKVDARLNVQASLKACTLIDEVAEPYNSALTSWMMTHGTAPDDAVGLRYALREVMLSSGRVSSRDIDVEIERLLNLIAATPGKETILKLVNRFDI